MELPLSRFDVVYDGTEFEPYVPGNTALIHSRFGGRVYCSAADILDGFISPAADSRVHILSSYGIDGYESRVDWPTAAAKFDGWTVAVPINRSDGTIPAEGWPVVLERAGVIYLTDFRDFVAMTQRSGTQSSGTQSSAIDLVLHEVGLHYIPYFEERRKLYPCKLYASDNFGRDTIERIVRGRSISELLFPLVRVSLSDYYSPFWNELKLYPIGNRLYLIHDGICANSWDPSQLDSVEALAKFLPDGYSLLNRHLLINDMGSKFVAWARFPYLNGRETSIRSERERSEELYRDLTDGGIELYRKMRVEAAQQRLRPHSEH